MYDMAAAAKQVKKRAKVALIIELHNQYMKHCGPLVSDTLHILPQLNMEQS